MQKGVTTSAYCKDTDYGNAHLPVECLLPLDDCWHAKFSFFFGGGLTLDAAVERSSAMQLVLGPALVS